MSDEREKTVLLMHQIFKKQDSSELSFFSENNQAFIKMLGLTVCRCAVSLNEILNRFLHKKIPEKQALSKTILLTAIAELLFMDSPDYAVINSYVEISKRHCGKAVSGFVNAVLRAVISQKKDILDSFEPKFFPKHFLDILQSDYDSETIKKIEQSSLTQPKLNLTVKNNPSQWAEKLKGQVISGNSVALTTNGKIENLSGYTEGEWWVQDIAASLAVQQFQNLKGQRVLDLCAAPGGKTAQLLNAGAIVTSLDCSEDRLKTLEQNLNRLHLTTQKTICADVLDYLENFKDQPFDAVLLDAPCSATGIFRRHPELVYSKTSKDVSKQATLQRKILEKISPTLKNGGELVYCVCSIAKSEGEKQISSFVSEHKEFRISKLTNPDEPQSVTSEGFIRTLPFHYAQTGGCDSFFIAKLKKEA